MRKKKTFRAKLYSIFAFSMIVPSILLSILFSLYYSREMLIQEEKNINYVLKSISSSLEVQFVELENIADVYYMQKEIYQEIEYLNNPQLYEYYDDLGKKSMENSYSTAITKMIYTSDQRICDVVFFPMNTEKQVGYYVDKNSAGIQRVDAEGYEKEEWFIRAIEADGRPVMYENHTPKYRSEDEANTVYSCVRAIRNMDNNKIVGVIKIDSDAQNLQKTLEVVETERAVHIMITRENDILAATGEPIDVDMSELEDGAQRIGKHLYFVQTLDVPETDWKLTYFFSMHSILINCILVLGASCIVTAAVLGIAFLIYRRHTKETVDDMEHITQVLHEIQNGNMDIQAQVRSGNELHDIAVAINHMVYNLKEYIAKEYIWVIRQQKAEYQALQAQINPHFLYNTLNGFIALNRMGETKKLEKSIINLTYLFRYACSKNDETTIEKECQFLQEYLQLEKLKYEERLEYIIWVDEECAGTKIPKLLLQPIVENSIVHGMGEEATPIMITIMARAVETKGIGKVTVVTVRDNGVGFDRAKLDQKKEHVGIDNVKARAELYCKNVIYQCVSKPGEGTKTTIVFGGGEGDERL